MEKEDTYKSYEAFAGVYDTFMDNIPYEEWSQYLVDLLKEYGVTEGILLDLGCGTGKLTRLLWEKGYDMIGVDNALEMLMIARETAQESESILYLLQDMREFELYGTVSGVVSICDSMNYILEESELLQVFQLVNNYLDPKGIFIFDLNTIYKYETILGETTICENRDTVSFIWENYYDFEEQLNEYDLTFFIQEEEELYRKYEEIHYQRAYEIEKVKSLIEASGLEFVTVYDAFTKEKPNKESERVYFIARECQK